MSILLRNKANIEPKRVSTLLRILKPVSSKDEVFTLPRKKLRSRASFTVHFRRLALSILLRIMHQLVYTQAVSKDQGIRIQTGNMPNGTSYRL